MREIIEGYVYDTEEHSTSLVASRDCPSESVTPLRYWQEDLYRTADGCWFLRGEGGPLTFWAQFHDCDCQDDCSGTAYAEGIFPLTPGQASLWLQDAGEIAAWRLYFGRSHEWKLDR